MTSSMPILFIWLLIAIFVFRYKMKKSSKTREEATRAFWQKEEASLVVRKKALDEADYVHPSLSEADLKPPSYYDETGLSQLKRQDSYLRELIQQPMVNFAHVTNTDLRLKYGTAMLTSIEQYEETYNAYVTTLYRMAEKLLEAGEGNYAAKLLEEGIQLGTDNRKHYLLLAKYYLSNNRIEKIEGLIDQAQALESLTKEALLKALEDIRSQAYNK